MKQLQQIVKSNQSFEPRDW